MNLKGKETIKNNHKLYISIFVKIIYLKEILLNFNVPPTHSTYFVSILPVFIKQLKMKKEQFFL